tara:strand:- start:1116 stop:3023 length:1908 start_codon:yes stop_codon:yes gene_type:complete
MNPRPRKKQNRIVDHEFLEGIEAALQGGRRVRRRVDGGGWLHLERLLPFLIVVRRSPLTEDDGFASLVTAEGSVLLAPDTPGDQRWISQVVETVGRLAVEAFGTFLVLEVWQGQAEGTDDPVDRRPGFRVFHRQGSGASATADAIADSLASLRVHRQLAKVAVATRARVARTGTTAVIGPAAQKRIGAQLVGIEVRPIHRNHETGELFPVVLRAMRRGFSRSLRRALFDFVRTRSTHRPEHFHVLGRRAIVKAVWKVDGQLAAIASQYDFLMNVTPANAGPAWNTFRRDQGAVPRLRYRPLPFDPALLKRDLYQIPVERVEDPALGLLFRQKQAEMDRQLTMLVDRNTHRFLPGSMALYGVLPDRVIATARQILREVGPSKREEPSGGRIGAEAFRDLALKELETYAPHWPGYEPSVTIRNDIASGLMVSRGVLCIGEDTQIPAKRVDALLQHEVGTHVLTYHNASAQPFQQLRVGLAGYDVLQEGLAVFAEYLVGGLTRSRLRVLAGRVLAVDAMLRGADFLRTYELLTEAHDFDAKTAFSITLRVHRGGGLTKDAFYLKGLMDVLAHLKAGGQLHPLYVGKIATDHIPIVEELHWRGVLREPPALPRFLDAPPVQARLERAREGLQVLDLLPR